MKPSLVELRQLLVANIALGFVNGAALITMIYMLKGSA